MIHAKRQPYWGWRSNYVDILHRLQQETETSPVPIFPLALWLYRNEPHGALEEICDKLLQQFNIATEEHGLFKFDLVGASDLGGLSERKITERVLFQLTGWPPGESHNESMSVKEIDFREVGPARQLIYLPNKRLNLVTGDNSLGKTFLLDSVWWAITGTLD